MSLYYNMHKGRILIGNLLIEIYLSFMEHGITQTNVDDEAIYCKWNEEQLRKIKYWSYSLNWCYYLQLPKSLIWLLRISLVRPTQGVGRLLVLYRLTSKRDIRYDVGDFLCIR